MLGLGALEPRHLKDSVRAGLVRMGTPPKERRSGSSAGIRSYGQPVRAEESWPMSIFGGPFYCRADLLAVRRELAALLDRRGH